MSCWPQRPNQFFLYFDLRVGASVVHRPALQNPVGQSLSIPQTPTAFLSSSTGLGGDFLARGASGGGAGTDAASGAFASLLACSAAAANATFASGVTRSCG